IADTGFPGSPKTGRSASEPNVIGLPGRIATFHKWSSAPHRTSASRTRSSSPTDTPAEDTSMSADAAQRIRSTIAPSRSGAPPRLTGRAPHERAGLDALGDRDTRVVTGDILLRHDGVRPVR